MISLTKLDILGMIKYNTLFSLQGLLRFAMEATKAEDAPGPSNLTTMDEEV